MSGLVLACLLSAGSGATMAVAQTAADSTGVDPVLAPPLSSLTCREFADVFYREIPLAVYGDDPDWLYELVIHAVEQCDLGEPLGRMQILASIWDGNFQEIIYGYNVVGWLADRYDPQRLPPPGTVAADFDLFSRDFADQLLPHVPAQSLEKFFCLYYAGRTDAAWELLHGEALADTWLRYYYEEEVGVLRRAGQPHVLGAYWGGWEPRGNQALVGTRHLIGASIEQGTGWGFLRLAMEGRLGRADRPYFVRKEGFAAYSDRWNAVLLAAEAGTTFWRTPRHKAMVFVGLGYDGLRPFRDEEVSLSSVQLSLGAGYRWRAGPHHRWAVNTDFRYEWTGERNAGGTPLGGPALSVRLGLVVALGRDPAPRLRALGLPGG